MAIVRRHPFSSYPVLDRPQHDKVEDGNSKFKQMYSRQFMSPFCGRVKR